MKNTFIKKMVASVAILTMIVATLILSGCDTVERKGIAGTRINDLGELIITYSDGSEENLGIVRGEDGKDGKDGADGTDGKDGADGKDGERGEDGADGERGADGSDGSLVISTDKSSIQAATSRGLLSAVSIVSSFTKTVYLPSIYGGGTTESEYSSAGSGVIYSIDKDAGDAIIITNYHVVFDASGNSIDGISEDIKVYLYGSELSGMGITAEYVGGSMYYDIAVLRVKDSDLIKNSVATSATIADSDTVSVGSTAIAVGNPSGGGTSASYGIISVESEHISMTAADESTAVTFRVMRVDTAVNPGNSGGGLYNDSGELIGIVNAKVSSTGVENIGYAIPSNVAKLVTENILYYCLDTDCKTVQRCLIGITVTITESHAIYDNETGRVGKVETVTVAEVTEGSLSDGKILAGDIIKSVTVRGVTTDIVRQYQLIDAVLRSRAGDDITVTVIRDGVETTVTLNVTEDNIISY